MPRLQQLLQDNTEEILALWESFARTLPMADSMDIAALRDHAKEMLGVIAHDLQTSQTAVEQTDKAAGKADADERGPPASAAQKHGAARAASGLTISQMISELRALRASVVRLWTDQQGQLAVTDMKDMIRFNESIDQAIAESVTQYSDDIGQTRERFLAILGHDLKNPLGAIIMSASFMHDLGEFGEYRHLLSRITSSARRMDQMVSDLLDFTRTRLGGSGMPIAPAAMDLARMVHDVVSEVATRYPKSIVQAETCGELRGEWDCARLTQAITNLVSNAVQHGGEAPITVKAQGVPDEVMISVRNEGPVIPEEALEQLFKPGAQTGASRKDGHLGLGLFIVDGIVAAHHGTIEVHSSKEDGTTFTVHLPRTA